MLPKNDNQVVSSLAIQQYKIEQGSYVGVGKTMHIASNCSTLWDDIRLNFTPASESKVEINGTGTSKCEDIEAPFIVMGEYYPQLGMGRLVKVHLNTSSSPIIYHLTATTSKSRKCVAKIKMFNENVEGSLRIFKA